MRLSWAELSPVSNVKQNMNRQIFPSPTAAIFAGSSRWPANTTLIVAGRQAKKHDTIVGVASLEKVANSSYCVGSGIGKGSCDRWKESSSS